jgi:hypothetical protein
MTTTTPIEPDGPLTDRDVLEGLEALELWPELTRAGEVAAVRPELVEHLAGTVPATGRARPVGHRALPARPARTRRGWWYAAGAALVAAVTAAVVVVPTLGEQPPQVAEASVLLDRAAAAEAEVAPAPGQWWRTTSTLVGLGVANGEQTSPQRVYRLTQTVVRYLPVAPGRPGYLVAGDRRYLAQVSGPSGPLPSTEPGDVSLIGAIPMELDDPWTAPTPEWVAALPRDPAALRTVLASYGPGLSGGDAATALGHAARLLELPSAPTDLRRAVLRALASYGDELSLDGDVTLGGRSGVALGVTETSVAEPAARTVQPENGTLTELVIDRASAQVLGYRTTTVGDVGLGVPDGTVMLEIALTRDVVDAVPPEVLENMPRTLPIS